MDFQIICERFGKNRDCVELQTKIISGLIWDAIIHRFR
jgi:hypothetical protein